MKKRSRDWRPTDGYEVAGSSNMFLDLKSGENDREEYLSDKVREYLQSLGMLSESKLPDMFYKDLESAILNSSFWLEDNDFDNSDYETYQGENAIQTDAARTLNLALQDFFAEKRMPIIAVVESVDPSVNKNAIISPAHKNYPNRVILGGVQTLSSKSQVVVLLHLATFSEDYDTNDINPSIISRVVARVIRHEVIHGMQLDKRKKNQKVSRKTAKKSFELEGQIPPKDAARTKYLKSHIEVDAYAHEVAEELYDLLGYEEARRALTDKNRIKNLDLSDQVKEYLYDHAGSKFTKNLVGKIYKHLDDFKTRGVLETRVFRRIMAEGLTSYDVEDVYSTAQLAHLGQKRRSGEDYFTHPRAVANIVRKYYPKDTRAYLVALLHDTIEDTEGVGNLSVKELTSMIGASIGDPAEAKDILDAVNALTHAKNQPYTEYVQGLTSNPMALKVKLADMMHNLSSTPTERQKLKYEKAIDNLAMQHSGNIPGVSMKHVNDLLKLTESENVLRKLIRKTLTETIEFHELDSPLSYNRASNVKRLALCDTSVKDRHLTPSGKPQRDTYFNDQQDWEYYGRSGRRLKKPRPAGIIPGVADACVIGFLDYHKEYEKSDGGTSWYIDYMKTRGDKGGTGTASKLVDEFFTRVASSGDTVNFGKMMNPKIGHLKDKMAKKYPDMEVIGNKYYG
tara:strand:+ start:6609 stop:8648 length:2040 start_codon:yes stop_codon:yes gene_type:complete